MSDSRKISEIREQTATKNELLERRMLLFAADTIRELSKHRSLPRSVVDQLTRAAASVGANFAEACNASSKQDFRNKIFIAKKEAAESRYWLDLCMELTSRPDWLELRNQAQEFLMILQTIINTLKGRSDT
jgi:four helix bundle protein